MIVEKYGVGPLSALRKIFLKLIECLQTSNLKCGILVRLEFFIFLLENYAAYKNTTADEVLKFWDELKLTDFICGLCHTRIGL